MCCSLHFLSLSLFTFCFEHQKIVGLRQHSSPDDDEDWRARAEIEDAPPTGGGGRYEGADFGQTSLRDQVFINGLPVEDRTEQVPGGVSLDEQTRQNAPCFVRQVFESCSGSRSQQAAHSNAVKGL